MCPYALHVLSRVRSVCINGCVLHTALQKQCVVIKEDIVVMCCNNFTSRVSGMFKQHDIIRILHTAQVVKGISVYPSVCVGGSGLLRCALLLSD